MIVGTFTTTDPRIDPSSYGVAVLHRDPKVRECGVWRGYYIRPDLHGIEAVKAVDATRTLISGSNRIHIAEIMVTRDDEVTLCASNGVCR